MSAVPKLRFPEFSGEWEEAEFDDLFATMPTRNHQILTSEILSEGEVPVVDQGKEMIAGYSDKSDLVLDRVPLILFGDHTTILKYIDFPFVIGADGTKPLHVRSGDVLFQYYNLVLNNVEQEGYKRHFSILRQAVLCCPSLPEQQKIASFLSSIDKKIDLLRQKKDALELYKQGLMQKIFSQEIRFKQDDGSDFPDWEEVTVGDMAERHVRGLTSSTLNFVDKGYAVYGASGVIGYIDNYISEQRYIGVVKDGAGVGRVFEAVEQSSLLSTMESIIPKAGFSFGFVKQVIKDIDFKKFTTGSTIPHVYFKDYSKESYPCPTYEEQDKIAHLLDFFDAKIQNTSSQIEQMETFKKGLLQQMFV